jgi:DNA-binding transcriptional LysR family regulator
MLKLAASLPSTFSPIESHKLHVFCEIAATGSVAAAARKLCLTRTALSHAIKALEQDLGCELFHRSHRSLHITAAGTRLLPHALAILNAMRVARESLEEPVPSQAA